MATVISKRHLITDEDNTQDWQGLDNNLIFDPSLLSDRTSHHKAKAAAVNDGSVDDTVTVKEDKTYTFSVADFVFGDINNQGLINIKITRLPTAGALNFNDSAVTVNQVIPADSLADLTFTPADNVFGAGYSNFYFTVNDGIDDSALENMITVNVTAVNDAPAGADKSIRIDEDNAYAFYASDFGLNDSDGNQTLVAITITSLPTAGLLALNGTEVTVNQVIPVTSIGDLVFTPEMNSYGDGYAQFSFTVNDGKTESLSANTLTMNVNALNDAPTGTDNTITVQEDGSYSFSVADFGFSDTDSNKKLTSVKIISLPAAGVLTLSGTAVAINQVIPRASIANLTFTPDLNTEGYNYAHFYFTVSDGFADSGLANTLTMDVIAINDAPSGTDKTISVQEDTTYTYSVADFGFSDIDSHQQLASVKITSLPTAGSLALDGAMVTVNQIIPVAAIADLTFTPDDHTYGQGYTSFNFIVRDSTTESISTNTITIDVNAFNDAPVGTDKTISVEEDGSYTYAKADFGFTDIDSRKGLVSVKITSLPTAGLLALHGNEVTVNQVIPAGSIPYLTFSPENNVFGAGYAHFDFSVNDGFNDSATTNTMTVDVTAINDAPTGTDKTITVKEDSSYSYSAADFGFRDLDNNKDLTSVKIMSLPAMGTLMLNGTAVTENQVIPKVLIPNLIFAPDLHGYGAGYTYFNFTVSDGTADSILTNTITVNVTAINDAPIGTDKTITIPEDSTYHYSIPDFGFYDHDSQKGLVSIEINSLPTAGSLALNGTEVSVNQVIPAASITNLKFTPANHVYGDNYASFDFTVNDGKANSVAANTITLNVAAINDEPTGTDKTITIQEDSTYNYSVADFGFSDLDSTQELTSIKITSLPTAGLLALNGTAVTENQVILKASIANLTFTPVENTYAVGYAHFNFTVSDALASSVFNNTIAMNVTALNDLPTGTDKAITVQKNGSYSYSAADFGFSDIDSTKGLASIKITSLPTAGSLTLNSTLVTLNQVIPAASIASLTYSPDPNTDGIGYASFNFIVSDGPDESVSANTITLNVPATNNAPLGSDKTITLKEDTSYTYSVSDFSSIDNLASIQFTSLPERGLLTLNGTSVNLNQVIPVASIDNLTFSPDEHQYGVGYAHLNFTVNDGTNDIVSPNTLTLNVTAINDAPTGTDKTITLPEDGSYAYSVADFGFTDQDSHKGLISIKITSLPTAGSLTLNNSPVTLNQVISSASLDSLMFTPADHVYGNDYASFDFTVNDGKANSITANTITINVTAVNDEPTGTDKTITIKEDSSYSYSVADFGFNDIDSHKVLSSIKITSLPTIGSLDLNDETVAVNQVIPSASIANLTYIPVENGYGVGYAHFNFTVNDGTADSITTNTLSINVTAVNDAPIISKLNRKQTYVEDTPLNMDSIILSDFDSKNITATLTLSNPASGQFNTATSDSVTSTFDPNTGTWSANGAISNVNDLLAGLTFIPSNDFNQNFTITTHFSNDDSSNASSSAKAASNATSTDSTITVTGTTVNDPPKAANQTITIAEDTVRSFSVSDFGFSDSDKSDTLSSIKITALTTAGTLTLSNKPVALNQVVTAANLGNLTFTPVANANGNNYDNFRFKVNDGKVDSTSDYAMAFNVTPVTDVPSSVASWLNQVGTLSQPDDTFSTSASQFFSSLKSIPFILSTMDSADELFTLIFGSKNLVVSNLMVTTTNDYAEISGTLSNGNRLTFFVGPTIEAVDYLWTNGFNFGTYFPSISELNGLGLSSLEFVLATDGVSVNNPDLGDVDVGTGLSLIGDIHLSDSTNKTFKFINQYLGVDSLSVYLNVDPIVDGLTLTGALNTNITLIKYGSFSITETQLALGFSLDPTFEPTFDVSNQIQVTGYDPSQSSEPTLSLTADLSFEVESVTIAGAVNAASAWKNPYGFVGAEIRNLYFQIGATYIPPFLDNVGVILDLRWSNFDINMAVSVDWNDPDKCAFALTLNQEMNVVALMAQMEVMALGPAAIYLLSYADDLFKYIPFTIVSIDGNNDGVLDPLVSFVPFPTDIGGQSLAEGMSINGRVKLGDLVGSMSFITDNDFTEMSGSLAIHYLKLGDFLTISGIKDGSDLSASFQISSMKQSLAGDGKFVMFGQTLAQSHFEISPTKASITDTQLALGPLSLNINYINYDLVALSASGKADISMVGYKLAGLDFNFNSKQLDFSGFIDLGLVDIDGKFIWNIANNTLSASGTMKINGVSFLSESISYNSNDGLVLSAGLKVGVSGLGDVGVSVGATINYGTLSDLKLDADLGAIGHVGFSVDAGHFNLTDLATTIANKAASEIGELSSWVAEAVKDGVTSSYNTVSHFFTSSEASSEITHALDNIASKIAGLFGSKKEHNETYVDSKGINQNWEGNGGNDVAFGNAGNDNLSAHQGNDALDGGSGNDTMYGGSDNDHMDGGDGNDSVYGQENNDWVYGGFGNDTLYGGNTSDDTSVANDDELHGGSGDDLIYGNGGIDKIYGDGGNDFLYGCSTTTNNDGYLDSLYGGTGNDTYWVEDKDFVMENQNEGNDTVASTVTYTLPSNVENLYLQGSAAINGTGNASDNVIQGNGQPNALNGGDGNDYLDGQSGNDTLKGGSGNDILDGGINNDSLYGGTGDDIFVVDGTTGDVVTENSNEGIDSINSTVTYTLPNNVENLYLQGTGSIYGTGNTLDNFIQGNGSPNSLTGGDGNDYLYGQSGNDTLKGGSGNDTLDGGGNNDNLYGGTGDDIFVVDGTTEDVVIENSNEGLDTINSIVTYTLPNNVENLYLQGTGSINGTGNTLDNKIQGNDATNTLIGDVGNDALNGGKGNDTITGGAGVDFFIFNTEITNNIDKITDFNPTDDTMKLDHSVFTQFTTTGALSSGMFVKGTAATDSNDYIIYNSTTGAVTYDADGNGAGAGVQIALLGTNLALTNGDFVII